MFTNAIRLYSFSNRIKLSTVLCTLYSIDQSANMSSALRLIKLRLIGLAGGINCGEEVLKKIKTIERDIRTISKFGFETSDFCFFRHFQKWIRLCSKKQLLPMILLRLDIC